MRSHHFKALQFLLAAVAVRVVSHIELGIDSASFHGRRVVYAKTWL